MVTSARPSEGKSLIVSALARKMANGGLRTLVVDVNARNRHYANALAEGSAPTRGLEDVLDGTLAARHAAAKVDANLPLYYLASDPAANAIYSVPESKLRSAFVAMKRDFDVVLIDTPAMESLSDALRLAAISDEVIVASLAERGSASLLQEVASKLAARSIQIKGVIITERHAALREDFAKLAAYEIDTKLSDVWPKAASKAGWFRTTFSSTILSLGATRASASGSSRRHV